MWGVVKARHFQWSPWPKPEWHIRRGVCGPRDHTGVSVHKHLVKTRVFHPILDGTDHLLHVESRTLQPRFLLMEIVKLLLDLGLQLEFLAEMRHLHVDVQIFKASQRLVNGIGVRVLNRELEDLGVSHRDREVFQVWRGEVNRSGVEGLIAPCRADNFLVLVAIVDVGGHFSCGEVVGREEEGVVTKG